MESIRKALQDLTNAVESNNTVERVKVTITLKKSNKAHSDNK